MKGIHPQKVIFPAVFFVASLLFFLSKSAYVFSHKNNTIGLDAESNRNASISSSFPASIQQWKDDIIIAAENNQLDPDFIAAIILQESGGQAQIISSSGAVGLMQVMPRDGKAASFSCVNGPCFENRPLISELFNPRFNINYGSNLLASLIRNKGSLRSALKAYGPMDAGFAYADTVLALYSTNHQP